MRSVCRRQRNAPIADWRWMFRAICAGGKSNAQAVRRHSCRRNCRRCRRRVRPTWPSARSAISKWTSRAICSGRKLNVPAVRRYFDLTRQRRTIWTAGRCPLSAVRGEGGAAGITMMSSKISTRPRRNGDGETPRAAFARRQFRCSSLRLFDSLSMVLPQLFSASACSKTPIQARSSLWRLWP